MMEGLMRRPKRKSKTSKAKAKTGRSRGRAKTAKSTSKAKTARSRSSAKAVTPRRKAKAVKSSRKAKATRSDLQARRARATAGVTLALSAADAATVDQITRIAATSAIAPFFWPPNRGVAPKGYMKGMALVFARVLCKLKAGDPAATAMAKAKAGTAAKDALVRYDNEFRSLGMPNDVAGPDTLRHLFALMIGHGMLESSGKHCAGRHVAAGNTNAADIEAGLFQTSFNAASASSVLPPLFDRYLANPSGFLEVFKEGVRCRPVDAENVGSGRGKEFQRLSKECPAFAVEFAAVVLRNRANHYGPIKRKEALVHRDAEKMLRDVQAVVDANPSICQALL
jgi:hypothetical protein